jgi:hypothetical protein
MVLEDGTVDGTTLTPVSVPETTLDNPDSAVEEAVSIAMGHQLSLRRNTA